MLERFSGMSVLIFSMYSPLCLKIWSGLFGGVLYISGIHTGTGYAMESWPLNLRGGALLEAFLVGSSSTAMGEESSISSSTDP